MGARLKTGNIAKTLLSRRSLGRLLGSGCFSLCLGLFGLLRAFAGSAHHELTAHEGLAMQHLGGALGILQHLHFHKGVALALVGAGIVDDFHAAHIAKALEQILQLSLRSLVGKIAHIEAAIAGGSHGSRAAALILAGSRVSTLVAAALGHAYVFLRFALFVLAVILAISLLVLLLSKAKETKDALQQGGLGSRSLLGARHTAAVGTALVSTAAAGAPPLPALCMMFSHIGY